MTIEAGRTAFKNMEPEKQQLLIDTGNRGSLEAVEKRTEEETESMRDRGRFLFVNKTKKQMILITSSQEAGLKRGHVTMTS